MSNWFECVMDLDTIKKGQRVVVGDNPDARKAKFYFKSIVSANHPSQRHYRFTDGYILFENGRYLDRARRVLAPRCKRYIAVEKPAYIFRWNHLIRLLWSKQTAKEQIERWRRSAAAADRLALAEIMRELVEPLALSVARPRLASHQDASAERQIAAYLEVLGLPHLEHIVAMLTVQSATSPRDGMNAAA